MERKSNMPERATAPIGDKQITIETGKIAKQADGAVTVQLGETIVIVAAVGAAKAKEGQDFFPLTVDYREKAAAAGKFPGGYFKREGRPTEKEILTSRLIDRPIRPLFPRGWYNEVQVQSIVLSADGENPPVTVSVGTAVFPQDGRTVEELFDAADRNLYGMTRGSRIMGLSRIAACL